MNEVKFWMVLTRKITYKDSIFKIIKKVWADSRFTLRNMSLVALVATLDLHPLFDNTVDSVHGVTGRSKQQSTHTV